MRNVINNLIFATIEPNSFDALFVSCVMAGLIAAVLLFASTGRVRLPRLLAKRWARANRNVQSLPGHWPVAFAAALSGFGLTGLTLRGLDPWLVVTLSTCAGLAFAAVLVWSLTRVFAGGDQELRGAALIGTVGRICLSVPEQGVGTVAYVIDGQRRSMPARGADGRGLVVGTEVMVTDVRNRVAFVEEF